MRLYFDTEFTGLHQGTTLISLGIISEDGRTFYAEFTDYDKAQVTPWIQENVIQNLSFKDLQLLEQHADVDYKNRSVGLWGREYFVRANLSEWLKQFDSVQFVSDVCHYDFVLLAELFGGALKLPENVSAACHDINQDIAGFYHISERAAFDKSREEIVEESLQVIDGQKHNALYDAKVIKAIYEYINLTTKDRNDSDDE